jgi:hypothetical protein
MVCGHVPQVQATSSQPSLRAAESESTHTLLWLRSLLSRIVTRQSAVSGGIKWGGQLNQMLKAASRTMTRCIIFNRFSCSNQACHDHRDGLTVSPSAMLSEGLEAPSPGPASCNKARVV